MDITIQIKVYKIFLMITINNCYVILFRYDEWKQLIFSKYLFEIFRCNEIAFET